MSRCPETEEYIASLMPDNCVWEYFWFSGVKFYKSSCGRYCQWPEIGDYCKHCGKPIMEIADDTSTQV